MKNNYTMRKPGKNEGSDGKASGGGSLPKILPVETAVASRAARGCNPRIQRATTTRRAPFAWEMRSSPHALARGGIMGVTSGGTIEHKFVCRTSHRRRGPGVLTSM